MGDFSAQIATQEFWSGLGFWILVVGLIGDILILAIPEHRGRLEKLLAAFFTIVVIVGCAFEHIADGKISELVTREERAAAVEIAQDKATAQIAAKQAADLGVTVRKLPDFVNRTKAIFDQQYRTFKTFADAERSHIGTIENQLNGDRTRLDKARDDAVNNAKEAEKLVAQAEATVTSERTKLSRLQADFDALSSRAIVTEHEVTERKLDAVAQSAVADAMRKWTKTPDGSAQRVAIFSVTDSSEAAALADEIAAALEKAGFAVNRYPVNMGQHFAVAGVGMYTSSNKRSLEIASSLVGALKSHSIAAFVMPQHWPGCENSTPTQTEKLGEDSFCSSFSIEVGNIPPLPRK